MGIKKRRMTLSLAVKFGVKSTNGFTIEKEVYDAMLASDRIQELLNNGSLYLCKCNSTNYTVDMKDVIGIIRSVNTETRKVEVDIIENDFTKTINFNKYQVTTEYSGVNNNGIYTFHFIGGFSIIPKGKSCYDR